MRGPTSVQIGSIDLDAKICVVAEIGNNHEGHFDLAAELVRQAAACGADAVKFQTYRTERFVNAADRARFDRLKSFELTPGQFGQLAELAHSLGIAFLSTPLDLESARFLSGIVDAFKIASGDNTFDPLLRAVARTDKAVVLSSGLCDLGQIAASKRVIEREWEAAGIQRELAVLHCVTSYPAPPQEANLAAIPLLARELGCTIGYSDHTLGLTACLTAVALGARIIEKHFTLDKQQSTFRDHQLSADPADLRALVQGVAEVNMLLGRSRKALQDSEVPLLPLVRRSIVAAADLEPGHEITWGDLMWTRPAGGLPPGDESRLLGRVVRRRVPFGERILPADID